MLTFIIPLLLGSIIGFLIRGKPSDEVVFLGKRRAAWSIGIGFVGLVAGVPIGLATSQSAGPQIAGLIGAGLGLGVFNILALENASYKRWSERKTLAWLIGGTVVLVLTLFFVGKQIPNFAESAAQGDQSHEYADNIESERKDEIPNSYLGVSLGDSEQQVRYVLGEPSKKEKQNDGELLFIYKGDYGIWFSPNGAVRNIACQRIDICPEFAGIKIGDEEAKVKAILGKNTSEKFQEVTDGSGNYLMKVITLSREKRVRIFLKEQTVIAISLSEPTEHD